MILLVDDDPAILDAAREVLEGSGFEVRTASGAEEALRILPLEEPELIISDVLMPGMDGFAFQAAVEAGWPNRLTPFLFLSSLDDPQQVVRGLETGAWDYLTKPFHPAVLAAKVRGIVATRSRFVVPSFRGELAGLPLWRLLDFASRNELSGELRIDGGAAGCATVVLVRGAVPGADRTSLLGRFPEGAPGFFVLRIPPPDWSPLDAPRESPGPAEPSPMGRLSGASLGGRFFSIQTEAISRPRPQVVTIVDYEGRVMHKRATAAAPDAAGVERQIEQQHQAVEEELRSKVSALGRGRGEVPPTAAVPPPADAAAETGANPGAAETGEDAFRRLLESGFARYREGNLAGALEDWEEADRRKPGDKSMQTRLLIIRAKLDRPRF